MYRDGYGVRQDYVQARKWMSLTASRATDDPKLKQNCATALALVAIGMTPEQMAEAERLAKEWKPRGQPAAAGE
jgi:TPR repeat protein